MGFIIYFIKPVLVLKSYLHMHAVSNTLNKNINHCYIITYYTGTVYQTLIPIITPGYI